MHVGMKESAHETGGTLILTSSELQEFDKEVVLKVYNEELKPSNFALGRIMCLEYSQYLGDSPPSDSPCLWCGGRS